MSELSSAESRDSVIKSLRLALMGPESPLQECWPGYSGDVVEINEGEAFPSDLTFGTVPMRDADGRELLAFPPTILYGVGILYPGLDENSLGNLIRTQSAFDSESDLPPEALETVDVDNPSTAEDDDGDDVEETQATKRQRSLAISFHLPIDTKSIQIRVQGSVYERLSVLERGRSRDVFARSAVFQEIKIDTASSIIKEITIAGISLRIGFLVRQATDAGKICTAYVLNQTTEFENISESALFQAKISVATEGLLPYPREQRPMDSDDESMELLYRDVKVLAVGHGCDSTVTQVENSWIVESEVMPAVTIQSPSPNISSSDGNFYRVGMIDLGLFSEEAQASVNRIIADYSSWRTSLEGDSNGSQSSAGRRHLEGIDRFRTQIEAGWELVQKNAEVRKIFTWVSLAMNAQRTSSAYPDVRKGTFDPSTGLTSEFEAEFPQTQPDFDFASPTAGFGPIPVESQAFWRPFQIAFLLSEIPRVVSGVPEERERVDIIWMPTGGGKTEAYLALAAFVMLFERVQRVKSGMALKPRTTVMMRYTLTLLTSQQVVRAAALMCALEILRKSNPELGTLPFRIGAWLGGGSTPNTWKQAQIWHKSIAQGGSQGSKSFLLQKCPWCSAQLQTTQQQKVAGYEIRSFSKRNDKYVAIYCPDPLCPFTKQTNENQGAFNRLPIFETDEDIYNAPPEFIVGTIDKFARLSWVEDSRKLFGIEATQGSIKRSQDPPSLFIQDELHLIAGPLGSLDALYEISLDELCRFDGGQRPLIIGATATTKNFRSQVRQLYGREDAQLLPPPGLSIDDSFFAKTPSGQNREAGKTFVAVCASGLGSVVESQLRVVAALAHAASAVDQEGSRFADAWWTNLVFFNSKRSIGLLHSTIATNLRRRIYALARLSGIRTGKAPDTPDSPRGPVRNVREMPELTASSRDDSNKTMARLARRMSDDYPVDICFATSMIEVGVDIPRLGLMTVMGQPKSESQYIQVTGRVGRSADAPGLVVVVLSPYNVRDRSNFESFTLNHQRLYASVEPVSLTPFTSQALDRGGAGAIAAAIRNTTVEHPSEYLSSDSGEALIKEFESRAMLVSGKRGAELVRIKVADLKRKASLHRSKSKNIWTDPEDGLMVQSDKQISVEESLQKWSVPNSMRSVEGQSAVRVARRYGSGSSESVANARWSQDASQDGDEYA